MVEDVERWEFLLSSSDWCKYSLKWYGHFERENTNDLGIPLLSICYSDRHGTEGGMIRMFIAKLFIRKIVKNQCSFTLEKITQQYIYEVGKFTATQTNKLEVYLSRERKQ